MPSNNAVRQWIVRSCVIVSMLCLLAATIVGWWGQQERERSLQETQQKLNHIRDQIDDLKKQLKAAQEQVASAKSTAAAGSGKHP